MKTRVRRFPPWLKKKLPVSALVGPVAGLLRDLHLCTVCQEAHCPNLGECFARGTATFMILGDTCTRGCTFCAVRKGVPLPVDPEEPQRVAEAAQRLGLRHVVVTSVTRDDLPDGGSGHFAQTVRAVHERCAVTVEVLTPDFGGHVEQVECVAAAAPDVYNHNVETVRRLYREVRPGADYARSLAVLRRAAELGLACKSGLMLGLGEREEEIAGVLGDLREAGCRAVTLGQYLQPSARHHAVVEFVAPEQFERLGSLALEMGFKGVASGPFVRSSYKAGSMAQAILQK